ncbi:hypothetical protein AAE478_005664 [Parahypoxylon ruwenzoriense]
MQFKAITIFALAAVAAAVPTEVQGRTDGGNSCNNSQQGQVCCTAGLLGCLVQILGSACSGEAYCCDNSAGTGSIIDIDLLNCVHL